MTDRPTVCERCKATVPAHAEWCPVCFMPFAVPAAGERRAPRVDEVAERGSTIRAARSDARPQAASKPDESRAPEMPEDPAPAVWPCPECDEGNPMELDSCEVCGTPFGRMFEEPKRLREVEPRGATIASLILPGLGHIRCGRTAEGVARILMFLWAGGTGLILSLSHASGLPVFGALFLSAAFGVYVVAAMEAPRIAEGGAAILPPRALLWGATVLAMLSIMSVFVVMAGAT